MIISTETQILLAQAASGEQLEWCEAILVANRAIYTERRRGRSIKLYRDDLLLYEGPAEPLPTRLAKVLDRIEAINAHGLRDTGGIELDKFSLQATGSLARFVNEGIPANVTLSPFAKNEPPPAYEGEPIRTNWRTQSNIAAIYGKSPTDAQIEALVKRGYTHCFELIQQIEFEFGVSGVRAAIIFKSAIKRGIIELTGSDQRWMLDNLPDDSPLWNPWVIKSMSGWWEMQSVKLGWDEWRW